MEVLGTFYLVATGTWPEVLVGEVELFNAERAIIMQRQLESKGTHYVVRLGGAAVGGQRQRQLKEGGRASTDQVSSSSSMKVSCGAMMAVARVVV